jgi:bile acid-coenzyme A ligase
MTVASIDGAIRVHARRAGRTPALVVCNRAGTEVVSWRELDDLTGQRAARLRELAGGRSPACVAVSLVEHNLPELLGLIAGLRTREPVVVVNGRQLVALHHALLDEVRRSGHALVPATPIPSTDTAAGDSPRTALDAGCLLLASGGSTGRPKLVVDRGIRATPAKPAPIRPLLRTGWRAGQRQLASSPLYHAAGLAPFVEGLVCGNTSYVLPVFDGGLLGEVVSEFAIEWLQLTPFHLSAVLAESSGPGSWRGSPRLVHTAEVCPPRIKRAFHEALGPTNVYELYAASEGIGVTMARGDEWDARPGTVGRGFCTALRVADREGRPLGPCRTGEVYMRSGRSAAAPYLGSAGRLRFTPDGFATLGDVGWLDEDGYLFLRPRQVGTITVAGVTVSPTEVEAELMAHPHVADVGVCSQASVEFGERVVAVVVPVAGGLTEGALRHWASTRLGAAQKPARYLITSALPRGDSGKLDRAALFELVNGGVGA